MDSLLFDVSKRKGGLDVTENQRIIENVNASMAMENMPMTESEKKLGMDCLEGKISFDKAVEGLISEYGQVI